VAVIHNASEAMVSGLLSRCSALVAQMCIALPDGRKLRPRISAGAWIARLDDTVADILRRADERMYQSKSAARGRPAGAP